LNEALQLADRILFFSARPAQVILDYTVPLARPRSLITSDLQPVQNQLLQLYPKLLSGTLNKES
jgi:NitT/TauT family transport system ATP-binding protein